MKYLIIQNGNLELADGILDWEIAGSADTLKDAKDFIREEALRYFDPDDIREDLSEYCGHYAICEVKVAVRPIPSVTVNLRLKGIAVEL